jgi:hypothetical protein
MFRQEFGLISHITIGSSRQPLPPADRLQPIGYSCRPLLPPPHLGHPSELSTLPLSTLLAPSILLQVDKLALLSLVQLEDCRKHDVQQILGPGLLNGELR